jgi:hypothetical protein
MKKLLTALLLVICLTFSIGQGEAQAQENCEQILNQGAATVETGWFTQKTATIGWYKGNITTDVKYDVCTPTAVLRININDWNKLLAEGKLNGFRYEMYTYAEKDGNYQNFLFRQIQDGKPQTITATQFRQ